MIPKGTYTGFKNKCSQFKNNVLEYLSVFTKFPMISFFVSFLCHLIIKKCFKEMDPFVIRSILFKSHFSVIRVL